MEKLTIEILNPKAKKLLQDLADMDLIALDKNSTDEVNEDVWNVLTKEQKEGIFSAIKEIEEGKGIPHEEIATKFRNKYSNG